MSVRLLLDAFEQHAPGFSAVGLRPNEHDEPLIGVLDRLSWEQLRLPLRLMQVLREAWAAHQESPGLLYSPALGAPFCSPIPVVAHVHDLIALSDPGQFSGAASWYWRSLLPASWKRCRHITVSNASLLDEVAEGLGFPCERISIVPYYPDPQVLRIAERLRSEAEPPEPRKQSGHLFVCLASHEPRKNLEQPILALARLKAGGIQARLVCVGSLTEHTKFLAELAAGEGVGEQVEFPGYLAQEESVALLLKATALLFMSRREGYGMPPQEAQSIGCPVLLSDIPCHRAVYADTQRIAVLPESLRVTPKLLAPDDADGLASEMQRLCTDEDYRRRLAEAGLAYCRGFSAEATAAALCAAFEAAAT